MGQYKIVCVDDEQGILDLYKEVLSDYDYEVDLFESPHDALKFISQNKGTVALVISDFSMPEMTGLEMREQMMDFGQEIPFHVVTGFYTKEMAVKGMDLNVSSFIEKPFNVVDIADAVEKSAAERIAAIEEEMDMITSFIEESNPMLEEIEDLILALENGPENMDVLNTYFRLLHTIKGTSACVGLLDVSNFVHKYEDLIGLLKEKKVPVSQMVIDTLLEGFDYLKRFYKEIIDKRSFSIDISNAVKIFEKDFSTQQPLAAGLADVDIPRHNIMPATKGKVNKDDEKLNVAVSVLDNFMELSGELTVLRNTVVKSSNKIEQRYKGDKDIEVLSEFLVEMQKVTTLLQSQVSEMRKISLETVFRPIKRVVRDGCKKLNKKINLEVEGESIMVDTSLARLFSNVLIHMVRNSVDHGIELPEKRIKSGKIDTGEITLKGIDEGENIVIEISDDGNGLDVERIKAKAIEKEMYYEEQLERMSNRRIFDIIFESGFSTAEQVTDISGRGVGMDMVKSSIHDFGGKILIDSSLGKGSIFRLVVPKPRSVVIIKTLLVSSEEKYFAIPLEDVSEVVLMSSTNTQSILEQIDGGYVLRHHADLISLVDLGKVLNLKNDDGHIYKIVILKSDSIKYGIIVDEIYDIEEIVIKKLSEFLDDCYFYSGASLVGNNELALILDIDGLARYSNLDIDYYDNDEGDLIANKKSSGENIDILQFTLNDKVKYAVPLFYVNRLEEVKSSSIEYSGKSPLVRYRGGFMPLVLLEKFLEISDIEFDEYVSNKDDLKVVVLKDEESFYGLIVNEILDIAETDSEISTMSVDHLGLYGTLYRGNDLVNIIDPIEIIANLKNFFRVEIEPVAYYEEDEIPSVPLSYQRAS